MVASVAYRVLRFFLTSIACSLPIYLGYVIKISDYGILYISFLLFILATGIEAYRFSFLFWQIQDFYFGQLIPLGIYAFTGFLGSLVFPPVVFNRIFLPLRFAGCFGLKTTESVWVISLVFAGITAILRFFGARAGHVYHDTHF